MIPFLRCFFLSVTGKLNINLSCFSVGFTHRHQTKWGPSKTYLTPERGSAQNGIYCADLQASGAAQRSRAASERSSLGSRQMGKTCGASSALGCAAAAHTGRPLPRHKVRRLLYVSPAALWNQRWRHTRNQVPLLLLPSPLSRQPGAWAIMEETQIRQRQRSQERNVEVE